MLRVAVCTGLVALGPVLGTPVDRRRGQASHHQQENMEFDGFPSYDRLPYDARIPAMIRSADTAEERQGGGGGGFSAPSFTIPFQPNFNFNEFSSPFGSDSSFSQFLSGLGGQGQLGQASPFVQQTEQRLNRPQGSSQFKRQTESYSPPGRQTAGRARPLERRPEPVYRPQPFLPPAQPYRRQEPEERRERVQPVYRARPEAREAAQGGWAAPEGFPKPDFPQMDFNLDFEPAKFQAQAKHMQENRRVQQDNRRPEQENRRVPQEKRRPQQEKLRPQQDNRRTQQENRRQQQNLRAQQEIRAQMELGAEQAMRAEQEMERKEEMQRIQAEQERQEMLRKQVQERQVEFSPPSLVEKFQQPVRKSEPYPFPSFPASTPAPTKPEPEQAKPVVTKKPVFQYEKKNFRDPVKAGARESLAHPLIRIRPKHQSASPRPALSQAGGFQPFRPAHVANPSPGKMEVMEVGRKGEPIVFDNTQEIIMAPQIVKNRNKNSFSVKVKSSFGAAGSRRPGQGRRRSIHLPRPVPPAGRPAVRAVRQKRQRSIDLEQAVPFFDSERV